MAHILAYFFPFQGSFPETLILYLRMYLRSILKTMYMYICESNLEVFLFSDRGRGGRLHSQHDSFLLHLEGGDKLFGRLCMNDCICLFL